MALLDSLKFLIDTSKKVQNVVKPILGSALASEPLGRGAGGDITRGIDKLAENVILDSIRSQNLSCFVVSEESGIIEIGSRPNVYVIIDSIDGTTNSLRGIPFFCTSIAISRGDRIKDIEAGVVMDISNSSIFYAKKNKGAYMGGNRIKTSNKKLLEDAVIAIDFSKVEERNITKLIPLFKVIRHMRHFGATALEICYIASGFMDAFVDIRNMLRVTDIASSYIILKEAGGEILTPEGKELYNKLEPTQKVSFIAAANSTIFRNIMEHIKQ